MFREIIRYIKSDYYRYTGRHDSFLKICMFLIYAHNHAFNFQFWLRFSSQSSCLVSFARWRYRRLSNKYNLDIHYSTKIGYGLYLGHAMCMVIDRRTVIGNNVNLSQFLNIGSNRGTPAIIKDNVYIGPSVCLVENVTIESNSVIGAGAVVIKDTEPFTVYAGVPAKTIKKFDASDMTYNYICNPFPLDE